jgi:pyruvate dehydrogenase E1 component alpha subunit
MPMKPLESFGVSYLQVLDEGGNVDGDLEPKLGEGDLVKLYRFMLLAREADQRALKLQRQGRIGTFGPCTGQEASSGAPAFAMGEKDWHVGAFRELAGQLVRGMPVENFFLFHAGYEEGNVFPKGSRTLPIAIVVASQTLHAVGIAYAMKYRGERDSAVLTSFGDGATSQGDFHEAMNFAAVWQAPVVFVCQNNQWAISMPRSKQTHSRTLAQKAIAYGMPGIQVDGNDALAMYRATKEALDRAHDGGGPTLIEAVTYRLMMHTTSDDPTRYRTDQEVEAWWKKEPLIRFRLYLEKKGFWDAGKQSALEADVKKEVEEAVARFEARRDYRPDASFDYVYGTKVPGIEAQRAEFLAHLPKEASHG